MQEQLDAMALEAKITLKAERMETASKIAGVAGMVGGGDAAGLLSMAGPAGMAAGGILGGAQALTGGATNKADAIANAKANAEAMTDGLMATIQALPAIISEVLPDLISGLISSLLEALPEIMVALTGALLETAWFLITEFPVIMLESILKGFRNIWTTIREWIQGFFNRTDEEKSEARARFMNFIIGDPTTTAESYAKGSSYVSRSGRAVVHRGEEIIPNNGRGRQRADMGGAGQAVNLTINTNVVDSDAIPSLVRQIEQHFGAFGRGSSPLFSGGY